MSSFDTDTKHITLLDAPGHRDFVPKMISGAAQADVAIIVVNGTRGEFESGFEADGQTKEHSLLIRSMGVQQVVVAINQLDKEEWCQARYQEIETMMGNFLKQIKFSIKTTTFVPVSGLTGENLVTRTCPELCAWYQGPTLLEAIGRQLYLCCV